MSIKTARKALRVFMILAVVLAIVGLVFITPGTVLSLYISGGAMVCMIIAMILLFGYCKCPWCGKRITAGLMKAEYCPFCKKDFDTGLKYKGKRK